MELFAFVKFFAQLIIALAILNLLRDYVIRKNPDSAFGKALVWETAS